MSYHKFMFFVTIGIGVFLFFVFHFLGVIDIATEAIKPKESGSQTYEVQSVEFDGKQTFWIDSREVVFGTEEGSFVFPKKHVTYEKVNGDGLSIIITSYDRTSERVVLSVGEENIENIRTNHARQFSENIKFVD